MKGYVPIAREDFSDFLFTERRVFSRFEAWADLLQLATFQNSRTMLVNQMPVVCKRDQVAASIRYLVGRWQWSRHKVCNFLDLLESKRKITIERDANVSRITVLPTPAQNGRTNGDTEGDSETYDSNELQQARGTRKRTRKGQTGDTGGTNTNKGNKGIRENNIPPLPPKGGTGAAAGLWDSVDTYTQPAPDNNPTTGQLPFTSQAFAELWQEWKSYRTAQFRKRYASPKSEAAALKHLLSLSGGSEPVATAIIRQSMGNTWQGLFPLRADSVPATAPVKKMVY